MVTQPRRISPGSGLPVGTAMRGARPGRPAWSETSPRARIPGIQPLDYPRPGAPPANSSPPEAAADPQAQTPRPPRHPRAAGHVVVRLRIADGGRVEDPRARSGEAARHAGEHVRLRVERPVDPRDPAWLAGADRRARQRDLAVDQARDRLGRGQALLRAPRRRP